MSASILNQFVGRSFVAYNADCVEAVSGLPDNSIGMEVYSPPFLQLFTYSNSDRDMGNCTSTNEFWDHFGYLIEHLYRVLRPGRIMAVHCCNIPAMKERDGYIGLKDFRGDLIRAFEKHGFIFHSEHVIWKDPLIEATRTKALGLLHKQLCKDSTRVRAGIPDYLVCMRKDGENTEPVKHPKGLTDFAGEDPPGTQTGFYSSMFSGESDPNISHRRWRRYASPVWMDIRQTRTLNVEGAREQEDEKHVCPLALDVIERALELYSNPGDTILSPFMGIGSEGYQALKMGRKFIGAELKESYWKVAVKNLKQAEHDDASQLALFPSEDRERIDGWTEADELEYELAND